MKKLLVFLCAMSLVFGVAGTASAVLFDFDALNAGNGASAIEVYMEGVYGSDITVTNARVGDGWIPEPLGPDPYIYDAGFGEHWFEISFNDVPITSVSFDWGLEVDAFHAYADGIEFFTQNYKLWTSGTSGLITFALPVTTLLFTNSLFGEIEVDNLNVTPVPEPATMLLLGTGLIGLAGLGRKKFLKK